VHAVGWGCQAVEYIGTEACWSGEMMNNLLAFRLRGSNMASEGPKTLSVPLMASCISIQEFLALSCLIPLKPCPLRTSIKHVSSV